MTKFIILFSMILSSLANAEELGLDDFKFTRKDNRFFIVKKSKDLKIIEANVTGRSPKITDVFTKPEAPYLHFVRYNAGESGTKIIIIEHRVALFNEKTGLFVGDLPYEYHIKGQKNPKENYEQPEWIFSGNKLIVKDAKQILKEIPL